MLVASVLLALFTLCSAQKGPDYPAHTFNQKIDHFPSSPRYLPHPKGTFKQRFFFDSTHYRKGGPVYLYIGGETNGENRFENLYNGVIYHLMKATNGLGVILENRYYGDSYPFENSTTDNLAFLTTEQTIADNDNFAQNVKFPGVDVDLTAPNTAWIMYGGSLAGAQTAFTVKTYGNSTIWGGIASSGVIHAVLGYPKWYAPIQTFGPQDCVASLNALIDQIDTVLMSGNAAAINQLKSIFGLEALQDNRDFAVTIAYPLGNPGFYTSYTWQELNWSPMYGSQDFFYFCNNVTNINAPASITKYDTELSKYTNGAPWVNLGNYANYIKTVIVPTCRSGHINEPFSGCFGTQHPHYWQRHKNTAKRSYLYTTCTEQGAYVQAPKTGPALLSRVVQTDYVQQWCTWAFPPGKYNSIPSTPQLWRYNNYGDLNFSADRLAFIDGSIDPWLDVCYHAVLPRYSSDLHPEYFIPGAGHHWDSYGLRDLNREPQFIRNVHEFEIRTVQKWLRMRPS